MNLPPFLTFSTKKGGTKSALKHFLSFEKDYTHYHYYYTKGYNTRIPLFKFGHILKVHAIPARDKGQREKYSGYDRKKLHILVLLSIDMGLISVSHLFSSGYFDIEYSHSTPHPKEKPNSGFPFSNSK